MSETLKELILTWLLFVVFTSIMVTMAVNSVGEVGSCEPVTWYLPIILFAFIMFPFWMGYLISSLTRDYKEEQY